jgi:hypothetical protein
MLTIFTLPKPFEGDTGRIQQNAVRSWKSLDPSVQVFLCGNTTDLDEAAASLGVDRVSGIACNDFGTPLVSSAFDRVAELSNQDVLCYANSDLIFLPDLLAAVKSVMSALPRFLIVGECWDVSVNEEISEEDSSASQLWEETLRRRASSVGAPRGPEWIDFFAFRRGTIGPLPDFAVGRPGWDNWMIWHARSEGLPVVDISPAALVVHQSHGYSHIPKGRGSRWEGPEADANRALLSFRQNLFSLEFATHRLVDSKLLPNRTGGIGRRVRVGLLLHAWTVPLYRVLRLCYRLARRFKSDPGATASRRKAP